MSNRRSRATLRLAYDASEPRPFPRRVRLREDEVLDTLVQGRRDGRAAPRMIRKLLKKQGRRRNRKFADLYGSFSVKCLFGLLRFLVWSGKAVPRPVACDQVRGARGRVSRDRNASAA